MSNHTILKEFEELHEKLAIHLRNMLNDRTEAILQGEDIRRLLYKIKYDVVDNKRITNDEKIAQLIELLRNECPKGAVCNTDYEGAAK